MIKILFLIHDLGQGGAEKVLVNLVNHMDRTKFDISVTVLFGGGVNEQFLAPDIKFKAVFPQMIPGNSHWMKLLTPRQLHALCVKEKYDVEVSFLEGPSVRVISGCPFEETKLVSWVHSTVQNQKDFAESFRNKSEAECCYGKMDQMIFVSEAVRNAFLMHCVYEGKTEVCYNLIESEKIRKLAAESVTEFGNESIRLVTAGTLKNVKGFDRLLRIMKKLKEDNLSAHLYILGRGPLQKTFEQYIIENNLAEYVTLLGYQINPYKYIGKSDLYICSSLSEGFSTAVMEAITIGVPICTVDVSGMKEILGDNSEYGLITENNEDSLYLGIKNILNNDELRKHYRKKAVERGEMFQMSIAVEKVEETLLELQR